jgi:hypothetical protein
MEDSQNDMHKGRATWAEMAKSPGDETKTKITLLRIDERIIHKEFRIA